MSTNNLPQCNCRTTVTKDLTERFIESRPDAQNHKVELTGYVYTFAGKEYGAMEAIQTAEPKPGNGRFKARKSKVNIMFTFCPFCGLRYNPLPTAQDEVNHESH